MKIIIIFVLLVSSASIFASDNADKCEDLRFEAQDIICNLEAKDSDEAGGETNFKYALKNKIDCHAAFVQICKANANDSCEAIQLEAQEKICDLEAAVSDRAAGTDEFKNALKRKLNCQKDFLNICRKELNK
jgi:NRPS condensation-like uncharacterized protein